MVACQLWITSYLGASVSDLLFELLGFIVEDCSRLDCHGHEVVRVGKLMRILVVVYVAASLAADPAAVVGAVRRE